VSFPTASGRLSDVPRCLHYVSSAPLRNPLHRSSSRSTRPRSPTHAAAGRLRPVRVRVAGAARGGLSPDGKWLAYTISKVSGTASCGSCRRRHHAGEGRAVRPGASFIEFEDRLRHRAVGGGGQACAARRRCSVSASTTSRPTRMTVDGIELFAFDRTGQSVAMKRYAPPAGGRAGPQAGAAPAGEPGPRAPTAAAIGTR
jgi:hypothetical protein